MKYNLIALSLSALLLTGCGGSSPDGTISTPDQTYAPGGSVDLVLHDPSADISDIQWQQTSGPAVELLTAKTKVISFTVPDSGDYSFTVNYLDGGSQSSQEINFSASGATPRIIGKLGHAVVENNGVSLRAFVADDIDVDTIQWQQISGPSVDFDNENITSEIVIFDAPEVFQDEVIEIEVSATDNGETITDIVTILVEDTDPVPSDSLFEDVLDDNALATVYAYNNDSQYADNIAFCVYSMGLTWDENNSTNLCRLSTLPSLGAETSGETPTIDQVMDRVVVSHDWMGARFREYLQAFDNNDDFKNMLRATTAIVISYDIRPSFYWPGTGAIYLDPNDLWLTADERDTINEAPDYRSNFGNELQFSTRWRYVKDNDWASFYYPPEYRLNRNLEDINVDLASLLYHELAHANDYLPSAEWGTYPDSFIFFQAAVEEDEISDELTRMYPKSSTELDEIADVRYRGEDPSSTQKAYLPADITGFFLSDVANEFYSYSSEREDLAMLFEELMMSYRYSIFRDVAVTGTADTGYIVDWGQRGRVEVDGIRVRANFTAMELLNEANADSANLPTPQLLDTDLRWVDTLEIMNSGTNSLQAKPTNPEFINKRIPRVRKQAHHQIALPKFH
ncbi:hypothetical protein [Thalassotalea crassostreae]|uniref:hypothetical protein n=1 Tax=Thalassotalea crassostreae TaxID=1763536 RepID=UPI0008395E23|nr:hypothetical protein [Thalassotalea crassostreae]